jgi:hypothetical protein
MHLGTSGNEVQKLRKNERSLSVSTRRRSQIILDRSPDSQAELKLRSSGLSAFPDARPSDQWKVFPDYSGGTAPDLHRLPFYALASTQDLAMASNTVPRFGCQRDQNNFQSCWTDAAWEDEPIFDGRTDLTGVVNAQPDERRVQTRSFHRKSVIDRGAISMRQNV